LWLFFEQAFLPDQKPPLSTFLFAVKTSENAAGHPVDKSVVKLWKDSAEGRGYWLAAIVGSSAESCKTPWATR